MIDRRSLRHALALGLVCAGIALIPGEVSAQQRHGDVNGDGQVSALDAQAILSAVVGLPLPVGYVVANGDANCLGGATALDAQIVLSFVIGLNVSQYCVGQAFGPGAISMTLLAGTRNVPDTTILINRGIWLRATLRDTLGFAVQRPIAWANSAPDVATIDTVRSDSAFVGAEAIQGATTVTASSDGVLRSIVIRVLTSLAGIVIQPQRGDTIRQINSTRTFTARNRDSVGVIGGFPNAFWTVTDTNIATVPPAAANQGIVTTKSVGTTWLRAALEANPSAIDSVPLVVTLPTSNTCTPNTGTMHSAATYTTPQLWTPAGNPHFVVGSQTFNGGSRLTLEPGTLVCTTSSAYFTFHAGSRLTAIGTNAAPIIFRPDSDLNYWYGLQLGDYTSLLPTAPLDTSIIRNVVFEQSWNAAGAVDGREQHLVLMDSVRIRQSYYSAATLMSQGSRMIRSTIDTIAYAEYYDRAILLGRGSLEESTIRIGASGTAIALSEAATVRQVNVVGGTTAISQDGYGADSARINDVTITGTSGIALNLDGGLIHPASGGISVTGGTGGVFRGQVGNLAFLFPDSLSQQVLTTNGQDSVFVTGGNLTAANLTLRPDLDWVFVNYQTTVDTLGVLTVRPGATLAFQNSGLIFQRGGTLNAHGTATGQIRFHPASGGSYFYGLAFNNPGGGAGPFSSMPVAQSTLINVRVDSAVGQCCSGPFGYGAINAADRHRLIVDSAHVRMSHNGAVHLAARGSRLSRSVIDTTGVPTSPYVAVGLGDSTLMENTIVRRGGNVGVWAYGAGARLRDIQILNGVSYGLAAETGILQGDSGSVTMQGNAYVGRMRIENLALLAPDSVAQRQLFSGTTVDSVVVITGGNLQSDTVIAIPQLRWQLDAQFSVDTMAQFRPHPGARIAAHNGGIIFQRGGTLDARGTAANPIHFYPAASNVSFYGLLFANPGAGGNPFGTAPVAQSTLINVRVDSATGQCCSANFGYAAISGADRHRLIIDSAHVRLSHNGAVHIAARGSRLSRSVIDTTGVPLSNYVAVGLGDTTLMESTIVRRSGYVGISAPGSGARLVDVQVINSVQYGLSAESGILQGDSGAVRMQGNAYVGRLRIENLAILAPDSVAQGRLLDAATTEPVVVVNGGNLNRDTVTAIPQLRWQLEGMVTVDTLAQFRPRPGARISGYNGGMIFQRGGTLDARGTPTSKIRFYPAVTGVNFYGLFFASPPDGGNPFYTAPVATSYLSNVQVDSASGQCCSAGFGYAAISAADRHRLLIDSAHVRLSHNGAVHIAARGSRLAYSVIDTTGLTTTGYVAVGLGDSTLLKNTIVRRSGQIGVNAAGTGARLDSVTILNSVQYGLHAVNGILQGDSGSVTLTGNSYAARMRLENVAALAADSVSQAQWAGNADNLLVVTGGTVVNDTVTAIPQLRWQVDNSDPTFSTGAHFAPRPGARITGWNGGLYFQDGGTIAAIGTETDSIKFYPATTGVNFYGFRLNNPPSGRVQSIFSYVRMDSVSGQCCATGSWSGYAAIMSGSGHVVHVNNSLIRKSHNGAIALRTRTSSINNVRIDTTGVAPGYTSGSSAVAMTDSSSLTNLVVYRSGNTGIWLEGLGVTMASVNVRRSVNDGFVLTENGGQYFGQFSPAHIVSDSNAGVGFSIRNNNILLSRCSARGNASHGAATNSSYQGVAIHNCDFEENGGNGVNNAGTTATYQIDAGNNYWGDAAGPAPSGDGVSGFVTIAPVCSASCTNPSMAPIGSGLPPAPAIPPRAQQLERARRRKRRLKR